MTALRAAKSRLSILLGNYWLMLVITAALLMSVLMFVDLNPVVDQNFFFSTYDPGIQQTKRSSDVSRPGRTGRCVQEPASRLL